MNLITLSNRATFSVKFQQIQDLLQQCMAVKSYNLGHLTVTLPFPVSGIPHRFILVRTKPG